MGSKPKKISASRGASILGLNDWQSQFEIWQIMKEEQHPGFNESRGYKLPDPPEGAPLRWGTAFEDAVITLAEIDGGELITDREKYFERENLTCHVDGIYTPSGVIHEGKTTSEFAYRMKWGEEGTDRIPQNYQVQVQHQMYAADISDAILSVLVFPKPVDEFENLGWLPTYVDNRYYLQKNIRENGGCEDYTTPQSWAQILWEMGYFHQYPVSRKYDTIKLMIEAYEDFWNNYIIGDKEPAPDTYEDVRRAFPEPVGTIVVDTELEAWIREYKDNKKEIGKSGPLSKRCDQLKVMILDKARKLDPPIDDESREKTIFMSQDGKKLGQFDGKTFR